MARKQLLEQDEEDEDEDIEQNDDNEEDVEKEDGGSFHSEEQINFDVRFKCMPSCDTTEQK